MNSLTRRARLRAGATLIEVMLASVILAVIALAGGAFIVRSRADIALQKNRRVAVELVNARLEELMYDWTHAEVAALVGSPVNENDVYINGRGPYRRRTIVNQAGAGHSECLRIIVRMRYNPRSNADEVWIETLRGR
jgi:prepilin-type N-terminal cleavage/methylation domain-containing protein